MRKYFGILIFFFFLTPSFSQDDWYINRYDNYDKHENKQDGIYGCPAGNGQMFHNYTTFYNYKNGQKEGWAFVERYSSWFLKYENNKLQKAVCLNENFYPQHTDMEGRLPESFIQNILTNKKNIPQSLIAKTLSFKDGKLDGECVAYDSESRQIISQIYFKNGVPEGDFIRYLGEDKKKHIITFKDGKPLNNMVYSIFDNDDTLSFYTLNNKIQPNWFKDSIENSLLDNQFYSENVSNYSIVWDALKPLLEGKFKTTYSGYYETPSGHQDVIIIRIGNIYGGLKENQYWDVNLMS